MSANMSADGHMDMRVVKTRRDIEAAFLKLLETHSFQKITVQMICKEALVNKGTFYRHYNDKYDLASQVARGMIQRLNSCVMQSHSARPSAVGEPSLFDVLQDQLPMLALLDSVGLPDINLRLSIMQLVSQDLREYATNAVELKNADTEAWVIAQLMLAYPEYQRDMKNPLGLYEYVRSVHEASEVFLHWLLNVRGNGASSADSLCMLPSARPSGQRGGRTSLASAQGRSLSSMPAAHESAAKKNARVGSAAKSGRATRKDR